jgi:transketolase
MLSQKEIKQLEKFATEIRLETLKEIKNLGFGHIGGAMSIVETLAVLYGKVMKINPKEPQWEDRDWLVVSKGHAGPAVYATLALKGYFPIEELMTLNKPKTNLPSHCDRNKTTGIDMTTGSLGQGMSTAIGIALGSRLGKRDSYTYLILGDGECDEGQVWEGALFAHHHKLDHLITFIDANKKQLDGYTKDINDLGDIGQKFASFGWYAQDINGADIAKILAAIEKAKEIKKQPSVIILDTIKGQGIKFVEETMANHHMIFSAADHKAAEKCIIELENKLKEYLV